MDGGRNFGIEESLRNGRRKGSIRGSMKKRRQFFLEADSFVIVVLRLLSLLLMNPATLIT
jgi:hypothetical protein